MSRGRNVSLCNYTQVIFTKKFFFLIFKILLKHLSHVSMRDTEASCDFDEIFLYINFTNTFHVSFCHMFLSVRLCSKKMLNFQTV